MNFSVDDSPLTVGKVPVKGVGLRVGLRVSGVTHVMSPAMARRKAREFETEQAKAIGLDWIAFALRVTADEIVATPLVEQMARVKVGPAMVDLIQRAEEEQS